MLNFNFNSNGNNKKQGGFVSDNLNKYYKKAKENIKRANILFPTMKDMKDDLEDEIEQWEKSKSKTNQDKTTGISGAIKIPDEESEEQKTIRLANSLYPTMKDKEEKPKEQAKDTPPSELDALFSKKEPTKLSLDKEAPKFVDFGGGLFAEDKRPLKTKYNKKEDEFNFDLYNKKEKSIEPTLNQEETKVLKGSVEYNEYKNKTEEQKRYACSENKDYKPQHDIYKELAIDSYSKIGNNIKDYKPLLESENKKTGFYSRAYIDHKTKTIVVVYKGTDFTSKKDLIDNDGSMAIHNKIPQQFYDAENFYHKINKTLGKNSKNYNIVFTGHSLGGTLAQLIGAKYGNETVTFNAYGAGKMKDAKINHTDNITNYGHIKDKIFNANKEAHIGNFIHVTDEGSAKNLIDYHMAENMENLKRSVKIYDR